jgi:uncharacterized membrane protein
MAELIVLGFKDAARPDGVFPQLRAMHFEGLIQLVDGARVIRREDGLTFARAADNLTRQGAAGGAHLGMFISLPLLMPLAGLVLGGATGALLGLFANLGSDDTATTQDNAIQRQRP